MGVTRTRWPATLALCAVFGAFATRARGDAPGDAPFQIMVTPAVINLGVDHRARVEITGPDVPLSALEIVASVGVVREISRIGPGRFTALFDPPASRAPDIAVIMARVRGASDGGVRTVPLAGRYHLTVTVEPNANVTVTLGSVGERRVVSAPASGVIDLFMHVPPGVETAHIAATDRGGNHTDTSEPLDVPPTHRVLMLDAPPPIDAPRAVRWLIVAAQADGTLTSQPPAAEVSGALGEVRTVRPGLFEVIARPTAHAEPTTVSLAVRMAGAVGVPELLTVVIPPAIPTTVQISEPPRAIAGERLMVPFTVRDAHGLDVGDLARSIVARIGAAPAERIEASGAGYVLVGRAPERTGTYEIVVSVEPPGARALASHRAVTISPGSPARLVLESPPALVVGVEASLGVTALDRYGNRASVGNPTAEASGARLIAVVRSDERVAVRLVPTATAIRITMRGDYELRDTIEVTATQPPSHPLLVGLAVLVRSNLGAIVVGGARIRTGANVRLVGRLRLQGMLEAGFEGASVTDRQGHSATVLAVPVMLRVACTMQFGVLELGPMLGAGAGWASVEAHSSAGDVERQNTLLYALDVGVLGRIATGLGVLSIEAGWEYSPIDTVPARGAFGGIFAIAGWSAQL